MCLLGDSHALCAVQPANRRFSPGPFVLRLRVIESLMPSGGVIFSDGVEADFLAFNAGAIATVRASERRARLAIG